MDKQRARKLIRETFEKAFDEERFKRFIKEFFNRIDEASFTYPASHVFASFRSHIKSLKRIGKFDDGKNSIDILIVTLLKETSLMRARTMQRNFIARYLNGSRGGILKDAALAAYVSPDKKEWRFSLIKMDYKYYKNARLWENFGRQKNTCRPRQPRCSKTGKRD